LEGIQLQQSEEGHVTVLFDGVCNLCNGAVHFIIKRDPRGSFRFASLQSDAGQTLLKQFDLPTEHFNSIVVIDGQRFFTRSSAALHITKRLSGLWPALYIGVVIPPFLRNPIYAWIARNRYRWFGRQEQCMLPTPELRSRFLE
jgi:predicted DCC family thiol-disulfide oxidoreductase YuxK